MEKNITEKVREYVEGECRKPTSKYGLTAYTVHFVNVVKYAKNLAENSKADLEIVELAAWLHDIGSIIYGRENHHITSAQIAETKLIELGYAKDKIQKIKQCILTHRGSQNMKKESLEAQIIADADGMSTIEIFRHLVRIEQRYEGKTRKEAVTSVKKKVARTYYKISAEAKKIMKPKYDEAIIELMNVEWKLLAGTKPSTLT